MSSFAILGLALVLDAIFGEPRWIWARVPHPAVLMGRAVGWGDRILNTGAAKRIKGVCWMLVLVASGAGLGLALTKLGWMAEVAILAVLLAHRSLVDHVCAVARDLRVSLGDGRRSVAMIVGRDTRSMDRPAVARAAIESAAENLSDGVIAPAFWYLVAGTPGVIVYKIANTADSMIGYRTPRYEAFGWSAARFDDLLNFVPSRLTALLVAFSNGLLPAWRNIAADARLHRSPNAGWPEAAFSRALGVALAGPRSYDGAMREFPYVNQPGRKSIGALEIEAACTALWKVWWVALALVITLATLT